MVPAPQLLGRMRILHAGPAYHPEGPGGIEVYLASLCRQQRAAGHDPVVLTGCAEAWPRVGLEEAQVDGCRVLRVHRDDLFFHHYAKAFHPGVEDLFDRVLSDERPDLVHVHHWLRLTCNLVEIAGRRGVPAVVTLHDTYASCPRCWRIDRDLAACSRELGVAACLPCVPRWGCESDDEIATGIELFRAAHRHELTAARAVLAPSRALG
jgi:glycosyltransferase involved in cell wall biosynthesis